jgi:hypothetical protein
LFQNDFDLLSQPGTAFDLIAMASAAPSTPSNSTLQSPTAAASSTMVPPSPVAAAATQKVVEVPFQIFVQVPKGDYIRLTVLASEKVDSIKRQLFAMNKSWDMGRQRLLISKWGQSQKQSRWGPTVMSPNPSDCVKKPLETSAVIGEVGIHADMILELRLVDPE